MDLKKQHEAAKKIQNMCRTWRARRHFRELLKSVIEKVYDEETGSYYYYNHKTGTSTWVKPKAFGNDDVAITVYKDDGTVEVVHQQQEEESNEKETTIEVPDVDEEEDKEEPLFNLPKQQEDGDEASENSNQTSGEGDEQQQKDDDEEEEETSSEEEDDNDDEEEEEEEEEMDFGEEELSIVAQQFEAFDNDGSGTLDAKELSKLLSSFGESVSPVQVKDLLREIYNKKVEEVDLKGFTKVLHRQRKKTGACPSLQLALKFKPGEIETIRKQFNKLDTDGSGEIDEEELSGLIRMLGFRVSDFDIKSLIKEVDTNENGTIDFTEFVHIVFNMRETKTSGFANLLKAGVTKGLFFDLADVLSSTRDRFHKWRNASAIAQAEEEERDRQKQRERLRRRKEKQEQDRLAYERMLEKKRQEEENRWKAVEGFSHEVELEGDQETYPNKGQYVRVHYVGKFDDGRVFESSRKRGTAFEFKVGAGHVIKGWDIALLRMSEGETANIRCSPHLAYGVQGCLPTIPPNTTLNFRIELIAVHERTEAIDESSDED